VRKLSRAQIEAAHLDVPLELSPHNLARYLTPPENSIFPLEYSFYLLGDLSGKTVLDYGCGPGEDTVILASKGASVVGIDISPDLIEVARKRAAINNLQIDFRVASADQTGLPDNLVDVVFAHAILHHLDLDLARREVLRVLKPRERKAASRQEICCGGKQCLLPDGEESPMRPWPLSAAAALHSAKRQFRPGAPRRPDIRVVVISAPNWRWILQSVKCST